MHTRLAYLLVDGYREGLGGQDRDSFGEISAAQEHAGPPHVPSRSAWCRSGEEAHREWWEQETWSLPQHCGDTEAPDLQRIASGEKRIPELRSNHESLVGQGLRTEINLNEGRIQKAMSHS